MRLREIQALITESIRINKKMLDVLFVANDKCLEYETQILEILKTQESNLTIKELCDIINPLESRANAWDKNVFSDILHLIEFDKIKIHGHTVKLKQLLTTRRRMKLMVGYANRIQQNRGLTNSYHWYSRQHINNISYKMRTDSFRDIGYDKDIYISKK